MFTEAWPFLCHRPLQSDDIFLAVVSSQLSPSDIPVFILLNSVTKTLILFGCHTPQRSAHPPNRHITPVLRELPWLPILERVKFKVACLVRQSLSGQGPLYLSDDCCLASSYSTPRSLRSADVPTCMVPRTLSSYQKQNFCSRWTSLMELCSGPAAQSRHHLQTVQTTADGTPSSANVNAALCDFWYAAA